MEINVRRVDTYQEITIREGNTTIETGLLGKEECIDLGIVLIRAAYDLLPDSVLRDKLIEIEEGL